MRRTPDKKKRAPNYSSREKSILINITMDFKNIIENKRTDTKTCNEKDRAWDKIARIFNIRSKEKIPRNKESLKKCYENLKGIVKKQMAPCKREIKCNPEDVPEEVEFQVENEQCKDMLLGIIGDKPGNLCDSQNICGENRFSPKSAHSQDHNENESYHSYHTEHNYGLEEIEMESESERSIKEDNELEWENEGTCPATTEVYTDQGNVYNQRRTYTKLTKGFTKLKMALYRQEIDSLKKRNIMEEELHQLRKTKLLLEIKKAELEIKKLQEI